MIMVMNILFSCFTVAMLTSMASPLLGANYPVPICTRSDIERTLSDTLMISLRDGILPLADYPLLKKFSRLKKLDFYATSADGADDQKLKAIADIGFTNLIDVSVLNSKSVTDAGVRELTRLPIIRLVQLEGTSVGDSGLMFLAKKSTVSGVNVIECDRVTVNGLTALVKAPNLKELGFSCENIDQADVKQLISEMPPKLFCQIVDSASKLEQKELKALAESKSIQIVFRKSGTRQRSK